MKTKASHVSSIHLALIFQITVAMRAVWWRLETRSLPFNIIARLINGGDYDRCCLVGAHVPETWIGAVDKDYVLRVDLGCKLARCLNG